MSTKKDSAVFRASDQESAIELYAVDVAAETLLFTITPRTNWVFKATDKRITGKLVARDHSEDAFGTLADLIGADVTPVTPTKKYSGASVDIEFTSAPVRDVMRLIADTGRVNVIVAPGELSPLTIRARRLPWDLALEVFATRLGHSAIREGNTFFIVPAGTNVEASKKKYTGPSIDLEMKDGTVADAVTAIRALTKLELGSCSATKLSFRVKRMPVQQVVKALEIASGEKLTDKTACPSKPIADEPTAELKLTAIAMLGAKRAATLSHNGAILVAQAKTQPRVKEIGSGYITFTGEETLQLYTFSSDVSQPEYRETAPPPPPLSRTAAVIKRGDRWMAIVERLNGAPLHLDAGHWVGTSGTVEIDKQGVRVTVEGESSPRTVPLGPKP